MDFCWHFFERLWYNAWWLTGVFEVVWILQTLLWGAYKRYMQKEHLSSQKGKQWLGFCKNSNFISTETNENIQRTQHMPGLCLGNGWYCGNVYMPVWLGQKGTFLVTGTNRNGWHGAGEVAQWVKCLSQASNKQIKAETQVWWHVSIISILGW